MTLRLTSDTVWNASTSQTYDIFLYPTQREVLNQSSKNWLYALGTGSGKTFISIHHYLKHASLSTPLLIVEPPAKRKTRDWTKAIKFVESQYDIEIDFVELSWGMLSKKWQDYKGYYVIVDECHTVKNSTSQVGKAFYQLSKQADGFCLLSATPMANGWEDSINYFKSFDMTKNKTQFLREYAITETRRLANGRTFPQIVDWRNQDELKSKWQSISIERDAEYFVELPTLNETFVEFNKSKIYKELDKHRVIEVDGELIAFDNLPKLNTGRRQFGNTKDKIEHLKMISDTKENVLVFYNFNREREALYELFNKTDKTIYEVSGHGFNLPDSHDVENTVTLVQYQAGGAGIELQYCSIIVLYSPTYSYQDYIQSIGRAYRPGGHQKLMMYKYKVKGTIDTQIYRALENKQDFKDSLYEDSEVTT